VSYTRFLENKMASAPPSGVDVDSGDCHRRLFGHQRHVVAWAARQGRAAVFLDTGLGKTPIQLEWTRLVSGGRPALVVVPLSVARQTVREAALLDIEARYVRSHDDVTGPGIWVTNYEMADRFKAADFAAVVLDECFAAGTLIDTPDGPKRIEDFNIGDRVISALGDDLVWDVHRREVPYAVVVSFQGQRVTCSPNHPWLTHRGWVGAQDLEPGDSLVAASEALRLVRSAVPEEDEAGARTSEVLRHILLSEVADERPRAGGEAAHARGGSLARVSEASLAGFRLASGASRDRPHSGSQPDEPAGSASQGVPPLEVDAPRTFRAWREWDGSDFAAVDADGCAGRAVAGGVLCVVGPADSRLSDALQARLGERRAASRYRSGWSLALLPQGPGREEGPEARFARVDGLEVLEPGDPRLDRLRDAGGALCFYDLGVVGHPSFSVAGRLVHNSSILKNHTGATRNTLIDQWRATPYRLACTATPAPNDVTELANHAEFLAAMSRVEMLASFFVHDDDGWRPKRHAVGPMYRWMSSWAIAARRPSDLGPFDDMPYRLPPLRIHAEIVEVHEAPEGRLFATDLGGVGGRARVRRSTMAARLDRAAGLLDHDWPCIAWCGLNPEADELTRRVPGAVNLYGTLSPDAKAEIIEAFQDGAIRCLVTKIPIAGMGLNLQRAAQQVFVGIGDSYEGYYQAIRRSWRFGQTEPVDVHIVVSELERQIVANVQRKEADASAMTADLIAAVTWEAA